MSSFPEEYSDGYVIFMGQRFQVDPRALIPRLETEELVKYCLKLLRENTSIHTVADIGTGSGIIPISIASKIDRPLQVLAMDMSREALELAGENFHLNKKEEIKKKKGGLGIDSPSLRHRGSYWRHAVGGGEGEVGVNNKNSDRAPLSRGGEELASNGGFLNSQPPASSLGTPLDRGARNQIHFLHGDLLHPLNSHFGKNTPEEILITANLPYVREKEINSGLIHEPRMAFLGGVETGFELYERFFEQLQHWKHRPKICHVVIEFGLWQRDIAETVFQKYGWKYSFFPDLRGIERFSYICLLR